MRERAVREVSLRRRVLFTAISAVLGAGILLVTFLALAIGPMIQQAQIESMTAQAELALSLEGNLALEQVAEAIAKPGTSVVISEPEDSAERGVAEDISVQSESDVTTLEVYLPKSRATLSLSASNQQSSLVLIQILSVGIPTLLVLSVVLLLLLNRAMTSALKPLDELTFLATQIASGSRGSRLENATTATELGRTAGAMNAMLDDLEGSIERAESAEEAMRQLNQDVAHEMRTPIASIIAAADNAIRDGIVSEPGQKIMMQIVRQAKRAAGIVGDLVAMNSIDESTLNKSTFSLKQLVDESIEGVEVGKLVVSLDCQDKEILADRSRLEQVIQNLLQNALGHAIKQVQITASFEGSNLKIVFEDDGPGIPAADRERIFDRFVRLDHSRNRQVGGSGLGLAITRVIVLAHGGSILATNSKALGGAKFIVHLPKA
jgi:two-component system OmpR family sensor kinase